MKIIRKGHGFTLIELLVVIGLIVLLVALVVGNWNPGSSKRQVTQSTKEMIESALERYHEHYGEYPEPANSEETAEIMPGKVYRIGAAKCLYQALRGDGSDAIKGVQSPGNNNNSRSDGQVSTDEIKHAMIPDMPEGMWRKVGDSYILVDAFGRPFQYVKADAEKKNTINATYDLWSYAEDMKNIMAISKDTEANASLGAKWIKNW
ncbi:type II secretion system protein [Prosthecobacter fluviatilis]|uniref:Type II secretion system protein n=1 Tax=Prosthecobacter fluviatilis TaxID=445931 RepID=A0ABW0KN14_9BACT